MNPSPRHLPGGSPESVKSSQCVFSTVNPPSGALSTVILHLDGWCLKARWAQFWSQFLLYLLCGLKQGALLL